MKEKIKVVTPMELIKEHEKNVVKSLQMYSLRQKLFVHFPKKRKVPLLGQFGIWLVNRYGGIITIKYEYLGGTIKSKDRRKK